MADPFVGMKVRDASLRGLSEALKALPAELASKRGGPLSRALGQAANVIRDDARERAPVGESGDLKENVKQKRDPAPGDVTERRVVYVGRKAWYWRFVEFGTERQPAQPFLRPAFEAKKEAALARFIEALKKGIEGAARRAARMGWRGGR